MTSENDDVIGWATAVMVLLVASVVGLMGFRNLSLFFASGLAAFLSSASFAIERVFHSPASEFSRDRISTMYYDDPELNVAGVLTATLVFATAGGLVGMALRRSKERVHRHRLEIALAVSVGLALGTIALCLNHYFLPVGENNHVFLCGVAILGAAFAYTRIATRPLEDPPDNNAMHAKPVWPSVRL